MGVVLLEIPAQILYLSSARSTNRVVPTTTKFSLSLKPNPAKWPPPTIAFRYKVSIHGRGGSPLDRANKQRRGRGKKSRPNEFASPPPGSIEWLVSHEIPHNCLSRNLEIAYFARPFFTEETIIKVIELVIAVIFHPLNPLSPLLTKIYTKLGRRERGKHAFIRLKRDR